MFGREAGDAVIAHTTQVLPAVFRTTDLVARTHDDEVDIMRLVTRENVLRMISEGAFQLTKEFRREDAGRIRWTSLVAHIVENLLSHHMIAFVYIADIERRHVEVSFASAFAKPNATTGLYSKESLERIAAAIQHSDTPEEPLAAVAVIRVAMPADLRAMLSAEDSTSEQVFLGQQLSVCLAQEGLVARYGADGFLVLFPRVDSETWLRQRIEASIADLRKAYVDKDGSAHPIVLACGYAVEEVSEMRFNDAVTRAKSACRVNEAEPTGSLWSFDERVGQMRRAMKPGSGRSMRTVSAEEMNRPLTGAEREALDAAMHAMIMRTTTTRPSPTCWACWARPITPTACSRWRFWRTAWSRDCTSGASRAHRPSSAR